MRSRIRVVVSGRVQGVAFRYYTRQQARSLGIQGWVRNLPDGSVECEIEGSNESLEKMLAFLHEGPRLAKVTNITIEPLRESGDDSGFHIRF